MTSSSTGQLERFLDALRAFSQDHPIHAFHAKFPWAKLGHLVHITNTECLDGDEWVDAGVCLQVLREGELATFNFRHDLEGPHVFSIVSLLPTYSMLLGDNWQLGLSQLVSLIERPRRLQK